MHWLKNTSFYILLQTIKCILVNLQWKTKLPEIHVQEEEKLSIRNTQRGKISPIPYLIWAYWEDEKIPESVQAMLDQVKRMNPLHQVIVLTGKTVGHYLPDVHFQGDMPVANKSDVIRLELLYRYGGIWLDCTVILEDSLDWVHQAASQDSYDVIGYYRHMSTVDFRFPIVESWLLAACPQNALIKKWLDVLKPITVMGSAAYFQQIAAREDYEIIKQSITTPSYLLIYLAGQIAMRAHPTFNLYLKKCEDSAFALQQFYAWNNYKINYALCRLPATNLRLPLIKLTSGDRMFIEMFRKLGIITPDSIIGCLLKKG